MSDRPGTFEDALAENAALRLQLIGLKAAYRNCCEERDALKPRATFRDHVLTQQLDTLRQQYAELDERLTESLRTIAELRGKP